jgi:hypothetical protein
MLSSPKKSNEHPPKRSERKRLSNGFCPKAKTTHVRIAKQVLSNPSESCPHKGHRRRRFSLSHNPKTASSPRTCLISLCQTPQTHDPKPPNPLFEKCSSPHLKQAPPTAKPCLIELPYPKANPQKPHKTAFNPHNLYPTALRSTKG